MALVSALAFSFAARYEVVHRFSGPMPTGITVSRSGRKFVCFPRWGDPVQATVAEIRGGSIVPYPNRAMQPRSGMSKSKDRFVSVQSVVVDPQDRLWAVDTGSVKLGPVPPDAAKLVRIDLGTNKVRQVIRFPRSVVLKSSYINDVRFDLRRGKAGYAFLTDSSGAGPNAIIVVDLASGESWRRLNDHASVKADPDFVPTVEGVPLKRRPRPGVEKRMTMGSDGIAISPDGRRLFYCPLISRKLYSVSVDALVDRNKTEEQVAATVQDLGEKGAADGLESDAAGNFYTTDYENACVKGGRPGSALRTLIQLPSQFWPDTLSVAQDGYIYLLANQLQRQKDYHFGDDLRIKPYLLVRQRIGPGRIRR